jgi:hypothetical protein
LEDAALEVTKAWMYVFYCPPVVKEEVIRAGEVNWFAFNEYPNAILALVPLVLYPFFLLLSDFVFALLQGFGYFDMLKLLLLFRKSVVYHVL